MGRGRSGEGKGRDREAFWVGKEWFREGGGPPPRSIGECTTLPNPHLL